MGQKSRQDEGEPPQELSSEDMLHRQAVRIDNSKSTSRHTSSSLARFSEYKADLTSFIFQCFHKHLVAEPLRHALDLLNLITKHIF